MHTCSASKSCPHDALWRASQAVGERMTVIDMRGSHARCGPLIAHCSCARLYLTQDACRRVVTNLERLSEAPVTGDEAAAEALIDATPMPELQHNLRLIVDLAEAEIQVRRARCLMAAAARVSRKLPRFADAGPQAAAGAGHE